MTNRIETFMTSIGLRPDENHAEQAGVKGMKWGIRKDRSSSSGSRPAAAKPATKATKPVASSRPKTFREKPQNRKMTDAELRVKLNRLQMEKQYKELTTTPKSQSFVRSVLSDTGKQVARQAASAAGKAALQVALEMAIKKSTNTSNTAFLKAMLANGGGKKNKN